MVDYFESIHAGNADEIISGLYERFEGLKNAKINFWEKDGTVKRFYVNFPEKEKNFNLNIKPNTIFVNDYKQELLGESLAIKNVVEFKDEIIKIVEEII